jgi:hypothetical protein
MSKQSAHGDDIISARSIDASQSTLQPFWNTDSILFREHFTGFCPFDIHKITHPPGKIRLLTCMTWTNSTAWLRLWNVRGDGSSETLLQLMFEGRRSLINRYQEYS